MNVRHIVHESYLTKSVNYNLHVLLLDCDPRFFSPTYYSLMGHCPQDFAVLGQFSAKIVTLRL